jgi:hypothetical protein
MKNIQFHFIPPKVWTITPRKPDYAALTSLRRGLDFSIHFLLKVWTITPRKPDYAALTSLRRQTLKGTF